MTTDRTLGPFIPCIGQYDTFANLVAGLPATAVTQGGVAAFCNDVGWVYSDKTSWRQFAAGGTGAKQIITSGASATVGAGVNVVIFDGAATTFALTLRAPAGDGDIIYIQASTAVSVALTIPITVPATVIKTVPGTMAAGVGIAYIYNVGNTTWYRLY